MVSHDMQAVLFDLDGTLLDTHDLLLATFRYTARTVLREAIPDERLMAKVGQPLNTQMWDFTDDPAVHEELCRVYREYNAEVHDDMIRLFDGTVPMLERLKEAGLPLAVVTSKRHGPRPVRPDRILRLPHRLRRLAGAQAASRSRGARLRTAGAGSPDVPVRGRQSLRHAVGKRRGLRHRGGAMGYVPSDRA